MSQTPLLDSQSSQQIDLKALQQEMKCFVFNESRRRPIRKAPELHSLQLHERPRAEYSRHAKGTLLLTMD